MFNSLSFPAMGTGDFSMIVRNRASLHTRAASPSLRTVMSSLTAMKWTISPAPLWTGEMVADSQ